MTKTGQARRIRDPELRKLIATFLRTLRSAARERESTPKRDSSRSMLSEHREQVRAIKEGRKRRVMRCYVLDGRECVPATMTEWCAWFEDAGEKRRVGHTLFFGEISISTICLGMDHSFGDGPPLLFETIIFGWREHGWQDRCSTYREAELMHRHAVALVCHAVQ